MKTKAILFLLAACFPVFFAGAQNGHAVAEWMETIHNFGKIKQNEPVTYEFEFKNISLVPLLIMEVEPSCDCTVPEYPKHPIKPQESAKIAVTFDAKKTGNFYKSVKITLNTEDGYQILLISGEVIP